MAISLSSSAAQNGRGRVARRGPSRLAQQAVDAARVIAELGERAPDAQQRSVLEGFSGWGPVAKLFDPQPTGVWAELADELDDAVGDAMAKAARVVDTSFFTPGQLVSHIYGVLRAAGFTGGAVLDLGCGAGAFMRHAPADMDIALTGVDADPLSAQIARALYPDASIITGELQKVSLAPGRFDAAVGNVPFSAANVHDGACGFYGSLHEYFVLRAVQAVHAGGYVVVVTSRHAMDSTSGLSAKIRARADLLAAVRLPSGYFNGTDVIADVLVLRVREGDEAVRGWHPGRQDATAVLEETVSGRYCREAVSRFWEQHPELVAGSMRLTGFDRAPLAVETRNRAAAVAAAFTATHGLLVPYGAGGAVFEGLASVRLTDDEGRKEGSLHLVDGQVVRVVDGELSVLARPSAELRVLIGLRDAAVALVDAESDWDCPDDVVEPLREACREAYTAYAGRFGAINRGAVTEGKPDPETGMPRLGWRAATLGGFRSDPDSAIVFALEKYDQETGEASPAPILLRRVNKRPEPVTSAATAGEALAVSLGEGRGLDLDRIAGLLGLTDPAEAFVALGNLAYRDPKTGRAIMARDYLCGDVRAKLREALAAAAIDNDYERNVSALEAVQPPWLGRGEIRVELGSLMVTTGDVAEFCAEVFGARAQVEHIAPLAAWEVSGSSRSISPEARLAYCTPRMDAFELLQTGLCGAAPVVWDETYDPETGRKRRVRNADQTEAAEQKLAAIQERFSLWIWESAERERRIVDQYNNTLNAYVLRQHDGSHLTFPALADGVELWPWQRDFVDRAVSTPASYCAHEVGLGKTLSAIAIAMTLRQFGLANRVGLIVPNHLIEQATRQAYQAWPAGRFLIVSRDDLHANARRRFAARCATGDYDLVIMTHESFSAIPLSGSAEREWIEEQMGELENYARAEGCKSKRIAGAVRALEGRLERLRGSYNDSNTVTFKHLGLDYLIVDEADRFRRLPIQTRADGFSLGASKRALDLFLKISALRRANPGRPHVCLMTGTPFTNTLAEGYVWQKMLVPEQLARTGLSHFDAWAAQFVRYEVLIEPSPDGAGFRSRRRPAVIQNRPEMRTMLSEFMSMVRAKDTGLERPEAFFHTEVVARSDGQGDGIADLVMRSEALRRGVVKPPEDMMLMVCTDGRKLALDPNLVGIIEQAPKLVTVAERVAEIYHNTRDLIYPDSETPGAFQLVLCDLGTPKSGDAQSYGRIRKALIARGVPAETIRFVHEASTPRAREALFAGCRDGSIAVLIGSTSKVGIGTNIQARLHSLHHVDPTWTAAAWEQRNGRALRNGNGNSDIHIYSYVTEKTFDAYMFNTVERKAKGFQGMYDLNDTAREIEDLGGDGVMTFGELKAAAAGNDLLRRQHELATQLRKLRLSHITAQQNVRTLLQQAAVAEANSEVARDRVRHLEEFAESRDHLRGMDLTRVAEAACTVRREGQYYSSYGHDWRGGPIRVSVAHNDFGYVLQLDCNYQQVWSEIVPTKVRRRGADAVGAWARSVIGAWVDDLDNEIERARARGVEEHRRSIEARETAGAADVDEPAELVAVRAELAEVDRAIADEAAAAENDRSIGDEGPADDQGPQAAA